MFIPESFDQVIAWLNCGAFETGRFDFESLEQSFEERLESEFAGKDKCYGVFLIRRTEDDTVLYVGKGGAFGEGEPLPVSCACCDPGSGFSLSQLTMEDIPERLRSFRRENPLAGDWLAEQFQEHKRLSVQYFLTPMLIAPAFLEALLLQSYLLEHKHLPKLNQLF